MTVDVFSIFGTSEERANNPKIHSLAHCNSTDYHPQLLQKLLLPNCKHYSENDLSLAKTIYEDIATLESCNKIISDVSNVLQILHDQNTSELTIKDHATKISNMVNGEFLKFLTSLEEYKQSFPCTFKYEDGKLTIPYANIPPRNGTPVQDHKVKTVLAVNSMTTHANYNRTLNQFNTVALEYSEFGVLSDEPLPVEDPSVITAFDVIRKEARHMLNELSKVFSAVYSILDYVIPPELKSEDPDELVIPKQPDHIGYYHNLYKRKNEHNQQLQSLPKEVSVTYDVDVSKFMPPVMNIINGLQLGSIDPTPSDTASKDEYTALNVDTATPKKDPEPLKFHNSSVDECRIVQTLNTKMAETTEVLKVLKCVKNSPEDKQALFIKLNADARLFKSNLSEKNVWHLTSTLPKIIKDMRELFADFQTKVIHSKSAEDCERGILHFSEKYHVLLDKFRSVISEMGQFNISSSPGEYDWWSFQLHTKKLKSSTLDTSESMFDIILAKREAMETVRNNLLEQFKALRKDLADSTVVSTKLNKYGRDTKSRYDEFANRSLCAMERLHLLVTKLLTDSVQKPDLIGLEAFGTDIDDMMGTTDVSEADPDKEDDDDVNIIDQEIIDDLNKDTSKDTDEE